MRTIKQNIKNLNKEQFELLKKYSKYSNSLYNSALYVCKNYYKETGKYIGLSELDKIMQSNWLYQNLPSFTAQEVVRLVDKNFRSFFALLNKKRNAEYSDKIHEPKFKKKGEYFILIFNNQRIKLQKDKEGNQVIKLYKNLKLKFNYELGGDIKQGIIKWNGINFVLYISYEQQNTELKSDNKKYLSIDLGLNNLATCVTNVGQSFIINGRPLKSYNQYYNKQKAKIQSELEIRNKLKWSKKLTILNNNRTRYIDNYMNQSVASIVKTAINLEINTIVLGYNETWKQEINLGSKTNQNFVHIPHGLFRSKLESKCDRMGLQFILQEESYTSKCSFIDGEYPKKYIKNIVDCKTGLETQIDNYIGKRIKRGLFKTGSNKLINADCNGASNILVKALNTKEYLKNKINKKEVVSETLVKEIGGAIVTPEVINIFNPLNLKYDFH